ncbi:MAG TPA: flagellar biosynthetic protein FliR [Candidatus Gastranaerophilales bacterium]|nr:flagellar biosynthetic protein FliR [Candidatus Gastranaerophilales bacterium]
MNDLSIFFSAESLIVYLLVFTRLTGMLTTAPLFSTYPIPMQIKVGLAALCAFIMYPFVMQISHFVIPKDLISLSSLIFKEIIVGLLIGFSASLIFSGVQIAGQLLSVQMGLAVATALDPVTNQDVPIVGQFYLFMASLVFIYINGHQWLFSTIYDSYTSIPIDLSFSFSVPITQKLIYFFSQLFLSAFSLILPIFEILFLIIVLMGFMAKIMPQMNIFMVMMPFKIYVGLSLMAMLIVPTAVYLMKVIKTMLIDLNGIFILGG